jgi:3-deoxy-D-manno-octulosonic-acid transferase
LKLLFFVYQRVASLIIPFLRLNPRLREGFDARTLRQPLPSADLWIQAASAGEAYLAKEIIQRLNSGPPIRILASTYTKQGFEILEAVQQESCKTGHLSVHVTYFPFDLPTIMMQAVQQVRPRVVILLETEIWPGFLWALKQTSARILLVNGRLTPKSLRGYKLLPCLWPAIAPDRILAVSEQDAQRFRYLFRTTETSVMSNIKFDRIQMQPLPEKHQNRFDSFLYSDACFVVLGSVRTQEESDAEQIIQMILNQVPQAVIGLFPRHLHRIKPWIRRLNQMKVKWILRSEINPVDLKESTLSREKESHSVKSGNLPRKGDGNPVESGRLPLSLFSGGEGWGEGELFTGSIILWDTFGELIPAYERASAAFVGGSLAPLGGQNYIEALISGVLPVTGPYLDDFEWVGPEIISEGLLRIGKDWQSVANWLIQNLQHPHDRSHIQQRALQYANNRRGGAELVCREIWNILN